MMLRNFLVAATVLCAASSPALAYNLTYQNMLIALMKLNPAFDYDNSVAGYTQAFRPVVWQQVHDDEFQRHNKESETLEMMKKAAANFNLNDPIVIRTGVQFGDYDFKQHAFAFNPFTESTYFPLNYCCAPGLPRQINLFISNPDIVDGLPMDEQAASAFVNQHKQYGNVNRQLNAEVSIKLTGVKADDEIIGEITKIVVHDPMNKNAVVQTAQGKTGS